MPQEETSQGAIDAINAALSGDAPAPEVESEVETPEVETPEVEAPEAEAPEAEAPAEETEAEAEARGAERNPDGTFKKKEAKVEEPKVEEPKVEAKKPEPKAKDPINDPIPKDLKKDTSERIRTLIDRTKAETERADKVQQDFDFLIKGVEGTGATPEQYGETLSWLSLFNSRNPADQEKALDLVESVAERLATLLGKERSVGDPLAAHADLKAAVAKNEITAQYAKEIARTRNGQQFRTELTTSATQAEQQRQQAQREEHEGRLALTELENTLRASDPLYEAKKAILVPTLNAVIETIPWSQRAAKFQEAYKNLKLAPTAAPAAKIPANQPLRAGKQPAGGQTRAAGSMMDALNGALSGLNNK